MKRLDGYLIGGDCGEAVAKVSYIITIIIIICTGLAEC